VIEDFAGELVAFTPDGKTWATGWASGARLFHGDQELAAARIDPPVVATAIGFSDDGATLRVGSAVIDASSGAAVPQPPIADLVSWVNAAGLPAPPKLGVTASRTSSDGTLYVFAASGVTRDRRHGTQQPSTGDVDWVIAADGATRKATDVLWHGKGVHSVFAISARHVAAAGQAPAKVFERSALTQAIELGGSPRSIIGLEWSPGGELLAAISGKQVVIWRAGTWDKPAATWEAGGDYHSGLAFHPTRPVLEVGNRDGHVRLYGVADAQLSSPPLLLDHDAGGGVNGAASSPDGGTLLVIVRRSKREVVRLGVTLTP
jgi:WD40 repeat protein